MLCADKAAMHVAQVNVGSGSRTGATWRVGEEVVAQDRLNMWYATPIPQSPHRVYTTTTPHRRASPCPCSSLASTCGRALPRGAGAPPVVLVPPRTASTLAACSQRACAPANRYPGKVIRVNAAKAKATVHFHGWSRYALFCLNLLALVCAGVAVLGAAVPRCRGGALPGCAARPAACPGVLDAGRCALGCGGSKVLLPVCCVRIFF